MAQEKELQMKQQIEDVTRSKDGNVELLNKQNHQLQLQVGSLSATGNSSESVQKLANVDKKVQVQG